MKKSKIKQKEYLKDLEMALNLVEKIDNLDPEKTNLKLLNKILKEQNKVLKNKYKDLDTEE